MSNVMRFWAEDASNIRCVRESDYDALQSRLNAVEAENEGLRALLSDAARSHGVLLMTDPPQDPWKNRQISERIARALEGKA